MNFFRKAVSTSIAFALASSSSCYVKGYTSDELKDFAARLLSAELLAGKLKDYDSYSQREDFKNVENEQKTMYDRTLKALNNFEENYGYELTYQNFDKYFKELIRIWKELVEITKRCRIYNSDIAPHYFWQEYIFNYPSKLDSILSNMNMAALQANDVKLDLLQNLSVSILEDVNILEDVDILEDREWINDFDKNFFKAAWEKGAIQEWVWYMCKNYHDYCMKVLESHRITRPGEELNDRAVRNRPQTDEEFAAGAKIIINYWHDMHWPNLAADVMKILAYQYEHLVKN